MYTGSYRPKHHKVVTVSDMSGIAKDHLVAVTCDNYDQEPVLARVTDVLDEEIDIVWLEGDYSKAWRVAKHLDPKNRRKMVEWKDRIPKASVILYDFKLTATNHLRKATINHLKKAYLEISTTTSD